METLKDHPQEIYLASRDAQEISDYLMERGRMQEHVREESVQDRQSREPNGGQVGAGPDRSMEREQLPDRNSSSGAAESALAGKGRG